MALFRPRIGKKQEYPVNRSVGQKRKQKPDVVAVNADVVAPFRQQGNVFGDFRTFLNAGDKTEQVGDAVLEDFRADVAVFRMESGDAGQMDAVAETDLQTNFFRDDAKGERFLRIKRHPGQKIFKQRGFGFADAAAFTAAEKMRFVV